jgi:uncharacterized membrane protein YeaQ/YmgE (transglycosylase-associated protein family)
MGFFGWIVLGLLAGIIAKLTFESSSVITACIIGVVGALFGGFFATHFGWGDVSQFDYRSLWMAIGGAVLFLFGYRSLLQERAHHHHNP